MEYNNLSGNIVDACITVHKIMGPGLLESIYEQCLMKEFQLRGIYAQNQVPVMLFYKDYELCRDLRIDILVEQAVILELKCSEKIHPVHVAQLISYLRLADKRLRFLINFNVPLMKDGIQRYVNDL